MDEVQKILSQQLNLLSERSQETHNCQELVGLTEQIINLAKALHQIVKNPLAFAELMNLPPAHLTISDLMEIAAVRKEKLRQADEELRQKLNEVQKSSQSRFSESK